MNNIDTYKPLGDRVIVEMFDKESERVVSGIIIAGEERESKIASGVVVAVGLGVSENGKRVPIQVKKGDKVLFSKYSYDEMDIPGKNYISISETNILGIYE